MDVQERQHQSNIAIRFFNASVRWRNINKLPYFISFFLVIVILFTLIIYIIKEVKISANSRFRVRNQLAPTVDEENIELQNNLQIQL